MDAPDRASAVSGRSRFMQDWGLLGLMIATCEITSLMRERGRFAPAKKQERKGRGKREVNSTRTPSRAVAREHDAVAVVSRVDLSAHCTLGARAGRA